MVLKCVLKNPVIHLLHPETDKFVNKKDAPSSAFIYLFLVLDNDKMIEDVYTNVA